VAICLAEAAIYSGLGPGVTLEEAGPLELFGEVGGRAVLACGSETRDEIIELGAELGVPVHGIGLVDGGTLLGVTLAELRGAWEGDG
jgi:hypothetical protein